MSSHLGRGHVELQHNKFPPGVKKSSQAHTPVCQRVTSIHRRARTSPGVPGSAGSALQATPTLTYPSRPLSVLHSFGKAQTPSNYYCYYYYYYQ